ncbi:hypothetical protein GCM10018953_73340 [Streptosporangium nondiastaticum]
MPDLDQRSRPHQPRERPAHRRLLSPAAGVPAGPVIDSVTDAPTGFAACAVAGAAVGAVTAA